MSEQKPKKFIFITGGVMSSIGKGIAGASIGCLLESRGLKITQQKLDPYINVDPGTMSPYQHGEVYVTDDGAETDLDLGHYERFTHSHLTKNSNATTGKIYYSVIQRERRGDYLGSTVQVIPHITDEIKSKIKAVADESDSDVVIVEIGGTVGDIESLPFLEAIRQFPTDAGKGNVLFVHLTLVPAMSISGELKTKPTQHSVSELRKVGIQPDILLCRSINELNQEVKSKIALFCNVSKEAVISAKDTSPIYNIPLLFKKEGLDDIIVRMLNLKTPAADLRSWEAMVEKIRHPKHEVTIAVVGKYVQLRHAYESIIESFTHAGVANDSFVKLHWVDAENIEKEGAEKYLSVASGILVPGGFGHRGIEGKVMAIRYARENKIPFFGICLGMQCAVIEFARNVLNLNKANSSEFNPETPNPVIHLLPSQEGVTDMGGTMRLGAYPCHIAKGSRAYEVYQAENVSERHRHRYEFNMDYRDQFVSQGMNLSGLSPDQRLVEIVEIPDHPWFVACQFHPEFKSRPLKAHPLFRGLVKHALDYAASKANMKTPAKDMSLSKEEVR